MYLIFINMPKNLKYHFKKNSDTIPFSCGYTDMMIYLILVSCSLFPPKYNCTIYKEDH